MKAKSKELKNVEEHVFHPGRNSNHYCSMLASLPSVYELPTHVFNTPLLIDYGLEASVPFDVNVVGNIDKLSDKLRKMRPSVVLHTSL